MISLHGGRVTKLLHSKVKIIGDISHNGMIQMHVQPRDPEFLHS